MKNLVHAGLVLLTILPRLCSAQVVVAQAKPEGKVCVAVVANMSTAIAVVDRMTTGLAKDLRESDLNAEAMKSRTAMKNLLRPTRENSEEATRKECDYVLLTQIVNRRAGIIGTPSPRISIGRTGPGLDASDPAHPSTVPRDNDDLQINFALFRTGGVQPLLDTSIMTQPSGRGPDNLMPAMDREASRVAAELKKR